MGSPSIGGFFSKLFGSENKERIDLNDPRLKPDAGAYNYGGDPNGAKRAAANAGANQNNFTGQANEAWGQGTGALDNANAARNQQQEVAAMTLRRARGEVPSAARIAGDRQMQQVVAGQRSGIASARSPAGVAAAQRHAAAATAAGQANVAGQTQVAESIEQQNAETAAQQAFTGIRAGDVGAANTAFGAGANAGQLGLGYGQLGHQINATQLGAKMNEQAQRSANLLGAAGINAGVGGQNAAMNQSNAMGAVSMAAQGLGVAAGGAGGGTEKRAAGGPVAPGQEYLVGEQGPELVIPQFPLVQARGNGPAAAAASPSFAGSSGMLGGSPMGELKAHSDFATRFQRHGGADPRSYEARAEGGPVNPQQPYLVGERGPELVVPQHYGTVIPAEETEAILTPSKVAMSTWGTAPPDVGAQGLAEAQAKTAVDQNRAAQEQAAAYRNPYQKVLEREDAGRSIGLEQTDDDAREERYARYMLARTRKDAGKSEKPKTDKGNTDERNDVSEGKALPKNRAQGALSRVANAADQAAGRVDVSYHGPAGGYAAPNLIPIGAREEGGPVDKGKPYVVGEKGPELVVPRKRTPEEEAAYAAGVADAPKHYGGAIAADMNMFPMMVADHGREVAGDTIKTALGPATLLADYFRRRK